MVITASFLSAFLGSVVSCIWMQTGVYVRLCIIYVLSLLLEMEIHTLVPLTSFNPGLLGFLLKVEYTLIAM